MHVRHYKTRFKVTVNDATRYVTATPFSTVDEVDNAVKLEFKDTTLKKGWMRIIPLTSVSSRNYGVLQSCAIRAWEEEWADGHPPVDLV